MLGGAGERARAPQRWAGATAALAGGCNASHGAAAAGRASRTRAGPGGSAGRAGGSAHRHQIVAMLVKRGHCAPERLGLPRRELGFKVGQLRDTVPHVLARRAEQPEDFEQLVNLAPTPCRRAANAAVGRRGPRGWRRAQGQRLSARRLAGRSSAMGGVAHRGGSWGRHGICPPWDLPAMGSARHGIGPPWDPPARSADRMTALRPAPRAALSRAALCEHTSESPGKSGCPVIISAMIVPTDHTSTGHA